MLGTLVRQCGAQTACVLTLGPRLLSAGGERSSLAGKPRPHPLHACCLSGPVHPTPPLQVSPASFALTRCLLDHDSTEPLDLHTPTLSPKLSKS